MKIKMPTSSGKKDKDNNRCEQKKGTTRVSAGKPAPDIVVDENGASGSGGRDSMVPSPEAIAVGWEGGRLGSGM